MDSPLQPFLQDRTVILRAPTQVWSAPSGDIGVLPIEGVYFSDVRLVSSCRVVVEGRPAEPIARVQQGADAVDHIGVLRFLDDTGADPRVRLVHRRHARADGVDETLTLQSALGHPLSVVVSARLASDMAGMDVVKRGERGEPVRIQVSGSEARWQSDDVSVTLRAGAPSSLTFDDGDLVVSWTIEVPAHAESQVGWTIRAKDAEAVVYAAVTPADWSMALEPASDGRLNRWVATALGDLDALRMTTSSSPDRSFLAAGAPWFFTLFGRDSIWAARFLVPLGGTLAADTLAILAVLQGTRDDPDTAEQPGKIMHELRRRPMTVSAGGPPLPQLYYGTIDATALWVCLLCDAVDAGMPEAELEPLVPALERALAWMRDFGDSDRDGLLEYIDESGRGLANQGWKDSGDSVQWRDGRLAEGPIALCEVQGYAYEAAVRGGALLETLGRDGSRSTRWAEALKGEFNAKFWIEDDLGAYPAIALDGAKRAVDGVTSNIGHLLGTGLLDQTQSELVARRLVSPEMSSGFGLRTMSTASAGYWPLSYHGGSVWAHDTAIAIRGLALAGFSAEAAQLADGLLRAAVSFDYRMPELHSGDTTNATAIPYPAACRPQAWSAAAAIAVYSAVMGPR